MRSQKQAGNDETPFGAQAQKDLEVKPLEVQLPDLHETAKLLGVKDQREEQGQERDRDGKRSRLICYCREPGCGIGPMVQEEAQ